MHFGKRKGAGWYLLRGNPLISAVDARKAPLSLTGTACGRLRSLLAREGFPLKFPLPQRALLEAISSERLMMQSLSCLWQRAL